MPAGTSVFSRLIRLMLTCIQTSFHLLLSLTVASRSDSEMLHLFRARQITCTLLPASFPLVYRFCRVVGRKQRAAPVAWWLETAYDWKSVGSMSDFLVAVETNVQITDDVIRITVTRKSIQTLWHVIEKRRQDSFQTWSVVSDDDRCRRPHTVAPT